MTVGTVRIEGPEGPVDVGGERLVLLAGPCTLESLDLGLTVARAVRAAAEAAGLPCVFKASVDKANRTSATGRRGPGLERGLEWLATIREEVGVPVTTDIHLPDQAARAARAVDLLQIPAFLSRQTDLVEAAAATGLPVNVKKGQFLSAAECAGIVAKAGGPGRILITERGTTFGYHDLVADLRNLPRIRALGVPVVFDATHAVQRPGAGGDHSGGERELAPVLARAAVAAGCDAVF
ncbi:MAG: 3-deoxy-8-phosphooctulonate synthase, partial [Myxococcales bacterium]|nr:3-deoxy-8-phosphooctulonate synthase [Myxococcales bacterium]